MEEYHVIRPEQPVDWAVEVPGSKSITNRALLLAALSDGEVHLDGVLFSDDSRYFLKALQALGYRVELSEENRTVTVQGCGGRIPTREGEIYVGSAGTAARFLTAMLGIAEGTFTIQASEQMKKRPMRPLFEALLSLGARIEYLERPWHLPVRLTGAGGALRAAGQKTRLFLDISESTQFLSAFLLIAPMFPNGLELVITSEKKDGSYIRITRRMMEEFGVRADFDGAVYEVAPASVYRRASYPIEPDLSAACYFYAAAAVTGGRAQVRGVHQGSMQGDLKFLSVLEQMGAAVREDEAGIVVTGPDELKGVRVDMNDFSDQALTLAAIAPFAASEVEITHVAHIRGQECDRLHAIAANLTRAGITCEETESSVRIHPGAVQPCRIETFEDHRVAMAFSLLGLKADGIVIENPSCCRKTFEHYFDLLDQLCKG